MNFGFCLDWSLLRNIMYRLSKFGNMFWKWFSYSWLGKFQIYVFLYSEAMIQFVLHYVEVELYYSYATAYVLPKLLCEAYTICWWNLS